jgi:hypothetical protein
LEDAVGKRLNRATFDGSHKITSATLAGSSRERRRPRLSRGAAFCQGRRRTVE